MRPLILLLFYISLLYPLSLKAQHYFFSHNSITLEYDSSDLSHLNSVENLIRKNVSKAIKKESCLPLYRPIESGYWTLPMTKLETKERDQQIKLLDINPLPNYELSFKWSQDYDTMIILGFLRRYKQPLYLDSNKYETLPLYQYPFIYTANLIPKKDVNALNQYILKGIANKFTLEKANGDTMITIRKVNYRDFNQLPQHPLKLIPELINFYAPESVIGGYKDPLLNNKFSRISFIDNFNELIVDSTSNTGTRKIEVSYNSLLVTEKWLHIYLTDSIPSRLKYIYESDCPPKNNQLDAITHETLSIGVVFDMTDTLNNTIYQRVFWVSYNDLAATFNLSKVPFYGVEEQLKADLLNKLGWKPKLQYVD